MTGPVYLDYNATTPLAPEVVSAISTSLQSQWGNPSSGYRTGQLAANAVKVAREQVANMVGASSDEITFTSSGTESNHLAIWSALANYRKSLKDGGMTKACPPSGNVCHPTSQSIPHLGIKK